MTLKDTFCSSPWFHIRINPNGDFIPCRWGSFYSKSGHNIATSTIAEFMNSDSMRNIRTKMLNGEEVSICSSCKYEDSVGKVSGRQRQLLKSAINIQNFDKTFFSSPRWDDFKYSWENHGHTNTMPVDLQIDLGNNCNSGCIMCNTTYSSRLGVDYIKLNKIEPNLFALPAVTKNWSDDPKLVDKFIAELTAIPNIRYIHFLGGETLYLKSFYDICERLIDAGLAKDISIGTTTNCTVHHVQLENIIKNFKHVHLGLSVEAIHTVNDYIRYPSDISSVTSNIVKFLELRKNTNLHLALRITPNIFSIYHLDTIFELMINNKITAESCDILHDPSFLRIELLPLNLVTKCLAKIDRIIDRYKLIEVAEPIINRRNDSVADEVIVQVIFEYRRLLSNMVQPENADEERYRLVKFTKAFEQLRGNNILEHLPEYEEFLRSYGY